MPEQPRPQEVVAAEAGLMVAMGTDPGFATHVAGLSAGEVAVEIAGQLPLANLGFDATLTPRGSRNG